MNISLDCFRYFQEAARVQNINLAAKSLRISPSAVFNAIQSLEGEYQSKLFDRVGRKIVLNEKGKLLLERTSEILSQVESVGDLLKSKNLEQTGYLSIGGSYFLAETVLSKLTAKLQTAHPNLRLEVSPLRTAQVLEEILQVKIGYGLGFSFGRHPDLFLNDLYHGKMCIVVSAQHPEIKRFKKGFSLSLLNETPAAFHKSAPGVDFCEEHPMFQALKIEPKITHYFHSDSALITTLKAGASFWAMIPDLVAKKYAKDLFMIAMPKNFVVEYTVSSARLAGKKSSTLMNTVDQFVQSSLQR